MNNILTGKNVLVTGGTGSIGSEIVKQVLLDGAQTVVVFSRDEIKHFLLRKRLSDGRLHTIVGDIRNPRSIEQVFRRFNIDIIYHTAAMKHVVMCEDFPLEAVATNIGGTQNIVDAAERNHVAKFITVSTDKAAYPSNVLGATKFIAERITLNANKTQIDKHALSCVRFGNVACSRGSVIPVYIDNLIHKNPLQITDPEVTRFIMEIPDAVRLIIKATEKASGGEIFILKMKAFKLQNLVDVIVEKIAPRLGLTKQDIRIETNGLVPGEKLHEDLISPNEIDRLYETDDMFLILPDNKAAGKITEFKKTRLTEYSSKNTELISNQELENMILKYLTLRSQELISG